MTTVVIPYRGGCPHRKRALKWLRNRYRTRHPDWKVIVSVHEEGPWVKAMAVRPGVEAAEDGVVIVADADVWTDGLDSAVRAITVGVSGWAMPYRMVYRLDEASSERYMAHGWGAGMEFERQPYEGVWGGGIVVAHRDTLLEVPLDPRFVGYGQEDEAHGQALWVKAGPGHKGIADLVHLHHPPQPRLSYRQGSIESWALYQRYANARWFRPDDMDALLKEADESYDKHRD